MRLSLPDKIKLFLCVIAFINNFTYISKKCVEVSFLKLKLNIKILIYKLYFGGLYLPLENVVLPNKTALIKPRICLSSMEYTKLSINN